MFPKTGPLWNHTLISRDLLGISFGVPSKVAPLPTSHTLPILFPILHDTGWVLVAVWQRWTKTLVLVSMKYRNPVLQLAVCPSVALTWLVAVVQRIHINKFRNAIPMSRQIPIFLFLRTAQLQRYAEPQFLANEILSQGR